MFRSGVGVYLAEAGAESESKILDSIHFSSTERVYLLLIFTSFVPCVLLLPSWQQNRRCLIFIAVSNVSSSSLHLKHGPLRDKYVSLRIERQFFKMKNA